MMSIPRCHLALLAAALSVVSCGGVVAAEERTLEERCRAEVVQLHRFLEEWSNADLQPSAVAFGRFADVIAPEFVIIDPDGSWSTREPIVEAIRGAYGRWREEPGRIRIENFRLHHSGGGLALVTYEEWHDLAENPNGRLSSALFGPNETAPNGIEWLHLHEVWLPTEDSSE